jgi:hypothetical protein
MLVGGAIAGSAYLANYDPFCHLSCTGSFGFTGTGVRDLGAFFTPNGDSFEAYRGTVHAGSQFADLFTLSNQGPLSIDILGIATQGPWSTRLRVVRVTVAPLTGPFPRERVFSPFTLAPQQFVDVRLTVEMRGCLTNDESLLPMGVPITYRVLGFTHHTTVYGNASIQLVHDPAVACP